MNQYSWLLQSFDWTVILIFLLGIVASYLGSFSAGWASSLGVGLLTLVGIPPQLATVTYKLGKIGDTLGGVYLLYKNGHIPRKFLLWWALAMTSGSFLGSYFIFSIPESAIYMISGMSMLVLALLGALKKFDSRPKQTTRTREWSLYASRFFLSVFSNMFIAGSGAWYYFVDTFVLGLSSLQTKGMGAVFGIFWYIWTLLGVLAQGRYMISWAIAFGFGMFLGGYFGTHHSIKMGNESLRKFLLLSIALLACYFLYLGIRAI